MYAMYVYVVFLLLYQLAISTVDPKSNVPPQDGTSLEHPSAEDYKKDTKTQPTPAQNALLQETTVSPSAGSTKGILTTPPSTKLSLPAIPYKGQSFREIKTSSKEYIIVDKTSFLKELIYNDDVPIVHKIYFLARPRSFGKSFFLSMVYEFLYGSEELFRHTALSQMGNLIEPNGTWQRNPVIHINFELISLDTVEDFKNELKEIIKQIANGYDLSTNTSDCKGSIKWLIKALKSKYNSRVSILIDGFDYPFTQSPMDIRNDIITELKLFYLAIRAAAKSSELWLVLIFGVSKLSMLSGALNGLEEDITHQEKFSSIMGFTVDETRKNFKAHLEILAQEHGTDIDTMVEKIINKYGGYRFSTETSNTLLDPGSVCSCLSKLKLYDFRSEIVNITGIIARMTKEQKGISYLEYYCISKQELYDPNNIFYTTEKWQFPLHKQMLSDGYLTIKTYCQKSQMVYLHYPNKGVEERIESDLPENLKSKPHDELHYEPLIKLLQDSLDKCDIDHYVELFNGKSFPMMSSSLESCTQKSEEEFFAAAQITQTLKTMKFDCEKGIALKTEGSDGENLDMVIFAQEDGKPHFVFEFKFGMRTPLEHIFQLFKYVVTLNTDFERVFDNKPKCNVIYLLGMVVQPYEGRETITDWILVPYKDTKIRIDKASSSDRGKWLLDLYIMVKNLEYYKQHEKYFILPWGW